LILKKRRPCASLFPLREKSDQKKELEYVPVTKEDWREPLKELAI